MITLAFIVLCIVIVVLAPNTTGCIIIFVLGFFFCIFSYPFLSDKHKRDILKKGDRMLNGGKRRRRK